MKVEKNDNDPSTWPGNQPDYVAETEVQTLLRVYSKLGEAAGKEYEAEVAYLARRKGGRENALRIIRRSSRWFPSPTVEVPADLPVVEAQEKSNAPLADLGPLPDFDVSSIANADVPAAASLEQVGERPGISEVLPVSVTPVVSVAVTPVAVDAKPESVNEDSILSAGVPVAAVSPVDPVEPLAATWTIAALRAVAKRTKAGPKQPAELWPDLPDSRDITEDVMWVYNNYLDILDTSGAEMVVWWEAARSRPPSRGALAQMDSLVLNRTQYLGSTGVLNKVLLSLENQESQQEKDEKLSIDEIERVLQEMLAKTPAEGPGQDEAKEEKVVGGQVDGQEAKDV